MNTADSKKLQMNDYVGNYLSFVYPFMQKGD
jgi:hypothetical protein